MRDRYLGTWADNGVVLAGIIMALRSPKILSQFLSLGRSCQTLQYGYEKENGQVVEIHRTGKEGAPLLVFFHGGAWLSGRPWMYRLMANTILKQGFDLALVGYTVYSGKTDNSIVGLTEHQVSKVVRGVPFRRENGTDPLYPFVHNLQNTD